MMASEALMALFMHLDEGEESAIHEHTGHHRDYARDGDALMGNVEPVASLDNDDADER